MGLPFGGSMSRRQLLLQLGAIGGSSLVFGAMNALELSGAPNARKPMLSGRPGANARVIILGAGVSGLVAGYELGKLGYDYQILEARDRVGGLAWSVSRGMEHTELEGGERQVCQFDEGHYINAGPWRIPHEHHGVIGYCRELGVRLEQFIDTNTVIFNENPALGPLANRKVHLRELQSDLWGQTSELLAKAVSQGALDSSLTSEDKERLLQFLVRAGYLNSADQVYTPDARMRGSAERYDLTALLGTPFANQVRSIVAGTGGPDPVFQPTGGMMQIAVGFQRAIGDHISFGSEVRSIRQTEDEVRVVYRETRSGAERELAADYVISCLPMSILKKLEVNLSAGMSEAVQATNHSPQAKMGLQMKRRFWEEDDGIYGGHLVYNPFNPNAQPAPQGGGGGGFGGGGGGGGGNPIPQFSYPSNDYGAQKGVLLGFYGNGTLAGLDGRPLSESPVQARVEHVLTHASKIHPQMREEFDNAYSVWWARVPYSEGAWAGNPGARMEQLSQADGRIYMGSAAVSGDPAWIEGAVESAWRTVETLHARVMRGA